jgi:hypothetical protein
MSKSVTRLAGVATAAVLASAPLLAPVPAQAAGPLRCHAHVSDPTPKDYTYVTVFVRTAPHAGIKTVAHYKTTNTTKHGKANKHGRGHTRYYISSATPGYRVWVDVWVTKAGRHGHCRTSFLPHR